MNIPSLIYEFIFKSLKKITELSKEVFEETKRVRKICLNEPFKNMKS